MKPKITVLVATKDRSKFIRGCLDSLLGQTINYLTEIVVIDSSSSSSDKDIVKEYQQMASNIKYMYLRKEGLYHAWNVGIKNSTGKYIINLNTDDRLKKNALEVMAKALDDNPKKALVYGSYYITNRPIDHVKAKQWIKGPQLDYDYKKLLMYCICGPHPMWRRKVHQKIGYFDTNFKIAGDYEFWLRMAGTYQLLHIPHFLGIFYQNNNSLSFSNVGLLKQERKRIAKRYFNSK